MAKFITAQEAAKQIPDGAAVCPAVGLLIVIRPQEEHLPVFQHFCAQAARIRGACHDAVCSVRHHFAGALPGFSCQLRSAEKDNAFFPAEESIRLHPVRKMRRHRQQPRSTQLDLL